MAPLTRLLVASARIPAKDHLPMNSEVVANQSTFEKRAGHGRLNSISAQYGCVPPILLDNRIKRWSLASGFNIGSDRNRGSKVSLPCRRFRAIQLLPDVSQPIEMIASA